MPFDQASGVKSGNAAAVDDGQQPTRIQPLSRPRKQKPKKGLKPPAPTIGQVMSRHNVDVWANHPPAQKALNENNPKAFDDALAARQKTWLLGSPGERRMAIEKYSGRRLPTDLNAAMANSKLHDTEIPRAAALMAKQLSTPMLTVFGSHYQLADAGNGRSVFVNPETGKALSTAAARRLYKPYEAKFYKHILRDPTAYGLPDVDPSHVAAWFRALGGVRGEDMSWKHAVGMAVSLANTVPPSKIGTFKNNLAYIAGDESLTNAKGKPMGDIQRIQMAQNATMQGIKFADGNDVVAFMLGEPGAEPAAGTAEHAEWEWRTQVWQRFNTTREGVGKIMDLAKGKQSSAYSTYYDAKVQEISSQYGSVRTKLEIADQATQETDEWFAGQLQGAYNDLGTDKLPVTWVPASRGKKGHFQYNEEYAAAAPADVKLALDMQFGKLDTNNYQLIADKIVTQYSQDEADKYTGIGGFIKGWVGQGFNSVSDAVNATAYTIGSGVGTAAALVNIPFGGDYDSVHQEAVQRMHNAAMMVYGEKTTGDHMSLSDQIIADGAKVGMDGTWFRLIAAGTEIDANLLMDPTNALFGGVSKLNKDAQLIQKAAQVDKYLTDASAVEMLMRTRVFGSQVFTANSWAGRVRQFLDVTHNELGGKNVASWLVEQAQKHAGDVENFHDAVRLKFRSLLGGQGIPKPLADMMHEWVNTGHGLGISDAELTGHVDDMLGQMMGVRMGGQYPDRLQNMIKVMEQDHNLYGGITDIANRAKAREAFLPEWQPWMSNADADAKANEVAKKLGNYWGAKGGDLQTLAIPNLSGYSADVRMAYTKSMLESRFGEGIRYRRSTMTSMAANLEENYPDWVQNYTNRAKGIFSRHEVEDYYRRAVAIADPRSVNREGAFIKLNEELQDTIVARLADKHGLNEHEVETYLSEIRTRARQLNQHMYGIDETDAAEWANVLDGDFRSVRSPVFETQLPNLWMTSDPVRLEKMLQEGLGYKKRVQEMYGKTFGRDYGSKVGAVLKGDVTDTLSAATVNHLVNSVSSHFREIALRYWKAGVVATPRYLLRVPLGDEQLRFLADAGVNSWINSRKIVGAAARRLGHENDYIALKVNDLYRSQVETDVLEAGFGSVDEALDAEKLRRDGAAGDDIVEKLDALDPDTKRVVTDTVDRHIRQHRLNVPTEEDLVVQYELPRPGEVLDEQAVNAQRADEVWQNHEDQAYRLLERMRKRETAGLKHWDELKPTDPGYTNQLVDVLVNQAGRSGIGRRVLRSLSQGKDSDAIHAEVVDYLTNNPFGKDIARRLGLFDAEAVSDHAELVERMMREWTMGDGELAELAYKGDGNALSRIFSQWVKDDPGSLHSVHGFKAEETLGERTHPGSWAWEKYSKAIFELPTNKLSRQPFFKHWYTETRKGLLQAAKDQGIEASPELLRQIEGEARKFAVERTQRVMFDFRKQSRFGELMWFVAPFYQPWAEAFQVWGGLLRKNPQFANSARILHNEMEQAGAIQTDPFTGEKTIPLSNWGFMAPLLNMAFGGQQGSGFSMSAPIDSFNFVFGSAFDIPTGKLGAGNIPVPLPSLNPTLMPFMQGAANSKFVPDPLKFSLTKWAYQYGDANRNFLGSLLPTYMQHFVRGAKSLPGAGLPIVSSAVDVAQAAVGGDDVLKSQADDFVRLYEAQGITPEKLASNDEWAQSIAGQKFESVADAQQYLADKATHQAEQLSEYRGIMSLFFPAAPSVSFPTKPLEVEYRNYVTELGYDKGRDAFLKAHPDNALITIPTTYWSRGDSVVPLPANRMAEAFLTQPDIAEFAQENPQWIFAMLPSEVWKQPFDRALFFQQLADGQRSTKGPLDLFKGEDAQKGWGLYLDAKQQNLAELENLRQQGIPENDPAYQALQTKLSTYTDGLRTLYPGFADKISTFSTFNLDPWVESGVDKALNSELFRETNVGQGLLAYRDLRNKVMGEMSDRNIRTLDTSVAEDYGLKQEYDQGVADIIKQYPDFDRAYTYFFRKDLRAVKTDGDVVLEHLATDPDAYAHYLDWSKGWNQQRLLAANQSNPDKVDVAYFQMRDMSNSAFQLYGDDASKNPMLVWWATRSQAEKDQYTASVVSRPYVFLSRFDRQVVLKEPTDDVTEQNWLAVGAFDPLIAKVQAKDPNANVSGLYKQRDKTVRQLEAANPAFAEQVAHANEWGYSFFHDGTREATPGREGEAWSVFHHTLGNLEAVVVATQMHGESDFGANKVIYKELKSRLLGLVTYLKDYSPGFQSSWEQLEAAAPGPDLLDDFMPDSWYQLGGYGGHK